VSCLKIKRLAFCAATVLGSILLAFVIAKLIWPIRFKLDYIAHGQVLDGGGGLVVEGFTSSQGIKLRASHSGYASPEKASEVFSKTLNGAARLIERTPKFNRQGLRVGERAVAILIDPENDEQYAAILWTDGRILAFIDSSSMTDVLQFEQYRNDE
jgi:hypothetical protein